MNKIGIRAEDKSKWEARVPLVPADIRKLRDTAGLEIAVQPSARRAIPLDDFLSAGAVAQEQLDDCAVVLGVKEIPVEHLLPGKTYVFFSHTIKAQAYNMAMLRHIIDTKSTLIDYERIVDESGRRLVFFGRFAGLAGMIDGLWTLGQRLRAAGVDAPFAQVRRAFEYTDLTEAKAAITAIGETLRAAPEKATWEPLVVGFAGYGNVSQGAQEIFDLLGAREIAPEDVLSLGAHERGIFKTVFHEEHLVRRTDGAPFVLQDYYDRPEHYESTFERYAPHLDMLVNCIYWDPRYPRLLSRAQLKSLWAAGPARLQVLADITCDVEGSLECTLRATEPGEPVFVYEPARDAIRMGVAGNGPSVLAVDILPCELPVDSSHAFSAALTPLVSGLAAARLDGGLAESGLPDPLRRATIVWQGALTPEYAYLRDAVDGDR